MAKKRLALDVNGNLVYCVAKPGKDSCDHICHQKDDETQLHFMRHILEEEDSANVSKISETINELKHKIQCARDEEDLDKLTNDESPDVREEVAKQGYGLDKLVNDEVWYVRRAVARQRYGLDKLVDDEDWHVREAVACEGYGLDKLINDKDDNDKFGIVSLSAWDSLYVDGYEDIDDWIKKNPDECALKH